MNIPIDNVIMLIGAAQGALIGTIIVQKHAAVYANRFLALMMFTISAVLVHMVLEDLGVYVSVPLLMPLLLSLSLAVTPLHFLYAKFLINRSLRFAWRDSLHFIPCTLFVIIGLVRLSTSMAGENFFAEHHPVEQYPIFFLIFNWAIIVQGLSYVAVILYRIGAYEHQIKEVYSELGERRLRWLRNITLLAGTAWCAFTVENTFLSFHINVSDFMVSSMLIAFYLFALGYLGMLKSEVLEAASPESEIAKSHDGRTDSDGEDAWDARPSVQVTQDQAAESDAAKYERSGLTPQSAERFRNRILQAMEQEKPYRQSDLTLSQLAALVRISPHHCSEVINTQLGKSFYDLVNEYRINDVKAALSDPSKQHLKILAIAFEAGFNSKASFNTVFKQLAHDTPSAFRKRTLAASRPSVD